LIAADGEDRIFARIVIAAIAAGHAAGG